MKISYIRCTKADMRIKEYKIYVSIDFMIKHPAIKSRQISYDLPAFKFKQIILPQYY